jgi:pyruvate formate lyase activating enzyme
MSSTRGLIADTVTFSCVDGPGNRFVVFMQGCNFDCIACHNPQTIAVLHDLHGALSRSVDDVLADIRRAAPFLSGITVSGGEATLQADFVGALFAAVKADPALQRLTCFVDSNGAAPRTVWDDLLPVMDGAMIDLKCLDPDTHLAMTGQPNDQVLDTIRYLHTHGRLYEVRLLLLPGVNDDPALLASTAAWLAEVDPAMRVTLIGLRTHGVRPCDRPLVEPTADQMEAYRAILAGAAPFDLRVV